MKGLKAILGISLAATGFAGSVAFGVATFPNNQKVEIAEAVTSGKLLAKLDNAGKWSDSNAKLCAYLTDDSSDYWTGLQTISSSQKFYIFDYSISFTPTKLIWVRMNPAATSGNWSQKWNQTGDLGWNEATYVPDQWDPSSGACSQWTITADVKTSLDGFTNPKTHLYMSTIEMVGDNQDQPQVSGSVTLQLNEEFKVIAGDGTWSGYYGCPEALDSAFTGGSKTGNNPSLSNIVCKTPGTYGFFFNTETKRIWISRDDIVDADGYAAYFLENVGCDVTGATEPSGWSDVAARYATLSGDAKNVLYAAEADVSGDNIARCVYWYDYAVKAHSGLTKFMVNSSGTPRASGHSLPIESSNYNNVIMIALISTSLIGLSVGTYFLIRKRKHQ